MTDTQQTPGFTPGPWIIIDNRNLNGAYWIGTDSITSHAAVRNGADDEEYGGPARQLANAHLIAAAPALYEALCKACQALMTMTHKLCEQDAADLERALAALALARGEAVSS